MFIGNLAKKANVNVQTLRFYERQGLLPEPLRLASGYPEYTDRDLQRVNFIRSCQEIGFTLKDIEEVLKLHRVLASLERSAILKPNAQEELLAATDRRLAAIDEKIRILIQMKTGMQSAITHRLCCAIR